MQLEAVAQVPDEAAEAEVLPPPPPPQLVSDMHKAIEESKATNNLQVRITGPLKTVVKK